METRFQTSFIPKKPLVTVGGMGAPVRHKHSSSIIMMIGAIAFVVSLGTAGGAFFWKSYLESSQEKYRLELAERERQFNGDLIEELKAQNVRIDFATQLLNKHIALSQIFDIIGRLTIESVRFTSLDVSAQKEGEISATLSGYGTSLSAVAWQSDVLGNLERYGLRKVVKNPILSDPALDSDGTVSFGFSASIDPSSMLYERSLAPVIDDSESDTGTPTNP